MSINSMQRTALRATADAVCYVDAAVAAQG